MTETKKLYRSCDDVILGGVASGIAEYFEIDTTLIRLAFALAFISGFGFLAYLMAWVIIPQNPKCKNKKTGTEEIKEQAEKIASDIRKRDHKDVRFWFGLTIVFFAISLLFKNIFGLALWHNFWPIVLVAVGIVLIFGSTGKK